MAETNALPTEAAVIVERSDISSYLPTGVTITVFMGRALATIKRRLEDKRGIEWKMVYDLTNDLYFDDTDADGRNKDRLQHIITLLAVAYIFKDYSIQKSDGGLWWALFEDFEKRAFDMLMDAKLDVDRDESGEISTGEEAEEGQVFLRR